MQILALRAALDTIARAAPFLPHHPWSSCTLRVRTQCTSRSPNSQCPQRQPHAHHCCPRYRSPRPLAPVMCCPATCCHVPFCWPIAISDAALLRRPAPCCRLPPLPNCCCQCTCVVKVVLRYAGERSSMVMASVPDGARQSRVASSRCPLALYRTSSGSVLRLKHWYSSERAPVHAVVRSTATTAFRRSGVAPLTSLGTCLAGIFHSILMLSFFLDAYLAGLKVGELGPKVVKPPSHFPFSQ